MSKPLFDYESASSSLRIPTDVMRELEGQARMEFPNDAMLMEIHVIRALKAYANERQLGLTQ